MESGKEGMRGKECVGERNAGPQLNHDSGDAEAGLLGTAKPGCESNSDGGRVRPIQAGIALCVLALLCVTGSSLDLLAGQKSLTPQAQVSTTPASRRILRIQHDSCYGAEGAFATETFENIGTKAICDGLCNMNSGMCISRAYMVGTKTCFLKIACQKQLGNTEFIPLEKDD